MWELLKTNTMDWRYWGQKKLRYNLITAFVGAFRRLILWIEGTEDKNNIDIIWSIAYVGGFKGLVLWIEGTEDKK